jgi:magnesium-protoporphyrin O-methyltransferase
MSESPGSGCCPTEASDRASVANRIARSFDLQVGRKVTGTDAFAEPSPISARLLELLSDVGEIRPSVFDLGCGPGTTAIRLALDGAGPVTGIDLSPASIDIARKRATAAGLGVDRIRFEIGDAASVRFQPKDWVVLDRVICCYDDMPRLLGNALSATRQRIAFAVPDSRGWHGVVNKTIRRIENAWNRLFRRSHTPGYAHDLDDIDAVLTGVGLRKVRDSIRGLWYAAVYEREPSGSSVPQ